MQASTGPPTASDCNLLIMPLGFASGSSLRGAGGMAGERGATDEGAGNIGAWAEIDRMNNIENMEVSVPHIFLSMGANIRIWV